MKREVREEKERKKRERKGGIRYAREREREGGR